MIYIKHLPRIKFSSPLFIFLISFNIVNANVLDNLYHQKNIYCNSIIEDRVKIIRLMQRNEQNQGFYIPNKNYVLDKDLAVCINEIENVCGVSHSGGNIQCVTAPCPGPPVRFHLKDYKTSCAACRNSRITSIFLTSCDQVEHKNMR